MRPPKIAAAILALEEALMVNRALYRQTRHDCEITSEIEHHDQLTQLENERQQIANGLRMLRTPSASLLRAVA